MNEEPIFPIHPQTLEKMVEFGELSREEADKAINGDGIFYWKRMKMLVTKYIPHQLKNQRNEHSI
jgi:hypothetical protein